MFLKALLLYAHGVHDCSEPVVLRGPCSRAHRPVHFGTVVVDQGRLNLKVHVLKGLWSRALSCVVVLKPFILRLHMWRSQF